MRKIQLFLSALVMFNLGCESVQEAVPRSANTMNYHQVTDDFYQAIAGALKLSETLPLVTMVDRSPDRLTFRIETDKISEATRQHIVDFYNARMTGQRSLPADNHLAPVFRGDAGKLVGIIDTTSVLSRGQKNYISALVNTIQTADNFADGLESISTFRNQVIHSPDLESNDKVLLLQIAAGSRALLHFLDNEGTQTIGNNINKELSNEIPAGRTLGCRVDWRDVWIGAVGTGLINASIGFYVGATAGTVTVPILGTATGAVGGAVFMGAIGFASGAIGGIATSLFTSCTRPGDSNLAYSFNSCDEAWDAYMNNQIPILPQDCFLVSVSVKSL